MNRDVYSIGKLFNKITDIRLNHSIDGFSVKRYSIEVTWDRQNIIKLLEYLEGDGKIKNYMIISENEYYFELNNVDFLVYCGDDGTDLVVEKKFTYDI